MEIIAPNWMAANRSINAVFGEDVAQGPQRKAPQILAQFLADWPGHKDDVITVGLEAPPRAAVEGFKVAFHRCQILFDGKLVGHALRMSGIDLSTLAAYEASWFLHRMTHAH